MKTALIISALLFALSTAVEDVSFVPEETVDDSGDVEGSGTNEIAASDSINNLTRAASRQVNCNCQCSSITFLDRYGQINGNCRSADSTGALWCYVDPRYSQCVDLRQSVRTTSLWSYQACATPEIYSAQCGGYLPFNGNGFGSTFSTTGYPTLASGPEGFPFNQNGGYPGLNSGSVGSYPSVSYQTSGSGNYPSGFPVVSNSYPTGSVSYPDDSNGYPTGSGSYPSESGSYPNLLGILAPRVSEENKQETNIVFSD